MTSTARELARTLLIDHEGYRERPYTDTTGHVSIGIGRNLSSRGLSRPEIELLFANDLEIATADAKGFAGIAWGSIGEARQAVLIDLAFNLGRSRLDGFQRFRACLLSSDWIGAKREMLDSLWARQVGRRAERLADIMLTGRVE